jgi:aryl carrier-like protein
VVVDHFPLTPSGKLDRRALPDPDAVSPRPSTVDDSTQVSPAEETFRSIFRELLAVTDVNGASNFFTLGGDSMLAITLIQRARDAGYAIGPREIVDNPTIAAIAAVATGISRNREPS